MSDLRKAQSENDSDSKNNALAWGKNVLLLVVAAILVFYGIKLTAWILKSALLIAAVGAVAFVGYSVVKRKFLSSDADEDSEPAQLEAEPRRKKARPAIERPAKSKTKSRSEVDDLELPSARPEPKVVKRSRAERENQADDALAALKAKMAVFDEVEEEIGES